MFMLLSLVGGYLVFHFLFHSPQMRAVTVRGGFSIEDVSLVKQTDGGTIFSLTLKNTGEKSIKRIIANLAGTEYTVLSDGNLQPGRTISFVETALIPPKEGFESGKKYSLAITATLSGGGTIARTTTVLCSGAGITEKGEYTVSFIQTGLPEGTRWSVTFGEITKYSTDPKIVFRADSGSYEWRAHYAESPDTRYAPSTSSGTISVPEKNSQTIDFSPVQYRLSANVAFGDGEIQLNPESPDGFYDVEVNVEAAAVPHVGFDFERWLLDDEERAEQQIVVPMDSPHILEAYFEPATPKFYKWSDGTMSKNITLIYNLFAGLWTHDENASYGITSGWQPLNAQIWIESISDTSAVENITLIIKEPDGDSIGKVTWQGETLPMSPVDVALDEDTIYTIEVWIKGAETVSNINVEVKLKTQT